MQKTIYLTLYEGVLKDGAVPSKDDLEVSAAPRPLGVDGVMWETSVVVEFATPTLAEFKTLAVATLEEKKTEIQNRADVAKTSIDARIANYQ